MIIDRKEVHYSYQFFEHRALQNVGFTVSETIGWRDQVALTSENSGTGKLLDANKCIFTRIQPSLME